MRIIEFLRPEAVIGELSGQTAQSVLAELCKPLASLYRVDAQRLLETLLEREKLGSTGIGDGVAIPHGKVTGLPALMASFGRSRAGVDFRAIDGKPTHLFFTLFAPENSSRTHLNALATISRISKNPAFRQAILNAKDAAEIYKLIEAEDSKY